MRGSKLIYERKTSGQSKQDQRFGARTKIEKSPQKGKHVVTFIEKKVVRKKILFQQGTQTGGRNREWKTT